MGPVGFFLRRLADERAAAIGLAVLVFFTALFVALGPRVLEQLSNEALHGELAAAPSFERNTIIYETARATATPPADWAEVQQSGRRMLSAMPADVRGLVAHDASVVETPLWLVHSGARIDSVLQLRVHDGALERLRLVSGRLPSGEVEVVRDRRPEAVPGQTATVFEVIMPASAAGQLGLSEDTLGLTAWQSDPINFGQNLGALARVVGTYELIDPADDFWINDQTVASWRLELPNPFESYIRTTALLSPAAYAPLLRATQHEGMALHFQWRFFMDTSRLQADRLPEMIGALRRLEGTLPRSGMSEVASDTTMSSGMLRMLLRHQATWQSAEAVLAVVALGALAIALATLAVVTSVASGGRRRVAALLAARGASTRQVLLPAVLEAALLGLPAVALAIGFALLIVPQASAMRSLLPAALVWAVLALILLVIVGRHAVASAALAAQGTRIVRRPSPRRMVVETTLVLGALGGAWLLRERGVSASGGVASELAGADLLVAAVPALVGLAAGLIMMRLYPLATRLLGALVALRRDLLPVLAVRRVIRGGSSAAVLLLLVVTASLGAFASAALSHLERSAALGAWQEVGADLRLSSATLRLPAALDEANVPGVAAAARASLRSVRTDQGTSWLLVLDPAEHARVVGGTPADAHLPAGLSAETAEQPLAAVVGGLPLRAGQLFQVDPGSGPLEMMVSEMRASFPGIAAGSPFVIVARDQLASRMPGGRTPSPTLSFVRAMPGTEDLVREALTQSVTGVTVDSRLERERQILEAPVMGALRALVAGAAAIAVAYAALAVGAALALAAADQRQQLAHLRALGVSRRETVWLMFVEYGPAALLGYLGGVVLGLALFAFLRPGLGLAAISGSALEVPLAADPLHLALLLAAIAVILVVGWLLAAIVQRDTHPATAIRRGTDS